MHDVPSPETHSHVDRGLEPRMDEGFVENAREDPPEAMPGDAHAASQETGRRTQGQAAKRGRIGGGSRNA